MGNTREGATMESFMRFRDFDYTASNEEKYERRDLLQEVINRFGKIKLTKLFISGDLEGMSTIFNLEDKRVRRWEALIQKEYKIQDIIRRERYTRKKAEVLVAIGGYRGFLPTIVAFSPETLILGKELSWITVETIG